MMKRKLGLVAAATAALVVLAGCSATPPADEGGKDITLWVMGGDTPDALRDYLKTEYASATGGTLTIEQQDWSDALSKLTTALPDPENTPDVVEIGNTWSPEVFIRSTEAEVVAAGSKSLWGEPFENWRDTNLVGTPEQVAEKIQTYVDLGCTGFIPWCPDYPSTETMELFASQVMPHFR